MSVNDRQHIGKCMAYLLRHRPQDANLEMDTRGWVDLAALVDGMNGMGYDITSADICDTVENDEKMRFELSSDATYVRALQGHSVDVDPDLVQATPPDVLYHGSATRFAPSIEEMGIISQNRNFVHLSLDPKSAKAIGTRHGTPCVYTIDAGKMARDGYIFYLSRNGIWLTDAVPPEYLTHCVC